MEVLETLLRLKAQKTTVLLSTHILADAERVCDEITIIDKGRLLVQATVEELRQRYATPVFEIEFEEPASALAATLKTSPWVEVVEGNQGKEAVLHVHVKDAKAAKRELPRLVAQSGLTLRRYEQVLPTLEQVFVRLVGHETEQS